MNERHTWTNPSRDFSLSWDIDLEDHNDATDSFGYIPEPETLHAPGVLEWGISIGLAPHLPESVFVVAAMSGELASIRALFSDGGRPYDYSAMPSVMTTAVRSGHLDIVDYLRASGSDWDYRVLIAAVMEGEIDSLQHILSHSPPAVSLSEEQAVFAAIMRSVRYHSVVGALTSVLAIGYKPASAAFASLASRAAFPIGALELLLASGCPRGSPDEQDGIFELSIGGQSENLLSILNAFLTAGFSPGPRAFAAACACLCKGATVRELLWAQSCPCDAVTCTISAVSRGAYSSEAPTIEALDWLFVSAAQGSCGFIRVTTLIPVFNLISGT